MRNKVAAEKQETSPVNDPERTSDDEAEVHERSVSGSPKFIVKRRLSPFKRQRGRNIQKAEQLRLQ
jgi:hypothetical protein